MIDLQCDFQNFEVALAFHAQAVWITTPRHICRTTQTHEAHINQSQPMYYLPLQEDTNKQPRTHTHLSRQCHTCRQPPLPAQSECDAQPLHDHCTLLAINQTHTHTTYTHN